jgi:nucleotide-binding universal stress UspA family protein
MYKHIVAGTDFSDLGDAALVRASELAIDMHAKLTLVHVVDEEDAPNPMYSSHEVRQHVERLEEAHQRLTGELASRKAAAGHIEVAFEIRAGKPSDQILAIAEEKGADLIVIASNGKKGLTRWLLGGTAERVVRGATGDVLVVNPKIPASERQSIAAG